jgi:protein TonB
MLEDALFESQGRNKKRNPITVAVSVLAHVAAVGGLVLVPLLQTQALTLPPIDTSLLAPRLEIHPPVDVFTERHAVSSSHTTADSTVFVQPRYIPQQVAVTVDEPQRSDLPNLPIGDRFGNRTPFGIFSDAGHEVGTLPPPPVTPPTPPPPPPAIDTHPIRKGGDVIAANLIYQVKPVYPPLAIKTRVQGVVVLEAVISKEGTISSLRVVSGHQLLTQAAIDAVKQWRYRPTLLNNEPVDVITTVTVTFTLQ